MDVSGLMVFISKTMQECGLEPPCRVLRDFFSTIADQHARLATTVILIDDDEDDLEIMRECIKGMNAEARCTSFTYAEDALESISGGLQETPDYIFIDINMPVISGADLLKEFRQLPYLASTVITMFSTSMPDSVSQALRGLGASHTFQKPFKIDDYHRILSMIMDKKN